MVEWAQSVGCEFNLTRYRNTLFFYAASNGSVDVLRWLHQKYPPNQYLTGVGDDVCGVAAKNGHFPVLEYLRSLGGIVNWNEWVSMDAARAGHLPALRWLREVLDPPCPWSAVSFSQAASNGDMDLAQWLRSQVPPCPWSEFTCCSACRMGHLEMIKFLRAQDPPCPWGEHTCEYAAQGGHINVLEWLRSQDPPCPWVKRDCIYRARNHNHHEVVEWILSQPE